MNKDSDLIWLLRKKLQRPATIYEVGEAIVNNIYLTNLYEYSQPMPTLGWLTEQVNNG
jgi:hypothetical protein